MRTINIHLAKTQLSRLVEQAAQGEPFVIAKAAGLAGRHAQRRPGVATSDAGAFRL